jgi:cephalosporin hydroxylase
MRMLSHEAAALVPDGSLDFVYIDAEHTYEGCLADLRLWSPKVRRGGIVSGDDYRFVNPKRPRRWSPSFAGVDKAVEEFVVERGITEWFYTADNERTILGVRYAEKGRAFPSFFWEQV